MKTIITHLSTTLGESTVNYGTVYFAAFIAVAIPLVILYSYVKDQNNRAS